MSITNFKRIWPQVLRGLRLLMAAFFFYGASVFFRGDREAREIGALCIIAGLVTLWLAFSRRHA